MTVPPPAGQGQYGAWNQPPAGGAWPPPAGVGGYPEPGFGGGYPGPGYPPPPPQRPGTSGFAIAALVLGILGFLGFPILLSIIFAIIALSQIRTSGQNGRGMAVAGLILSAMWVIGFIVLAIVAFNSSAKRDPGGTINQGGDISATALKVGDCVNNLKDSTDVLSLPGVPCTQPHEGEVFAVFDLPAGDYPGQDAVDKQVSEQCNTRLSAYSPSAADDPAVGLFSVYPLRQNWERGDREVVCIATATSGTTTGSIKGK